MANISLSGSIGTTGTSILGSVDIVLINANYTLNVSEYTNNFIYVTGTITATRDIILPLVKGLSFIVSNNTTGGFAITAIGASGSGVLINNNNKALIICDGVSYYKISNEQNNVVAFDGPSVGPENLIISRTVNAPIIDNTKLAIVNFSANNGGVAEGAQTSYSSIVGGLNNRILAPNDGYSSILGGTYNTGDGAFSNIIGGQNNTSGNFGTVINGENNFAGSYSTIINGIGNTIGPYGTVINGINNSGDGYISTAFGYGCIAYANVGAVFGHKARSNRYAQFTTSSSAFTNAGNAESQHSFLTLCGTSVSGSTVVLASGTEDLSGNGADGTAEQQFLLEQGFAYAIKITVVAATNTKRAMFIHDVLAYNEGVAVIELDNLTFNGENGTGWTFAITATGSDNYLNFEFTGEGGINVRAVATIDFTEVNRVP